MASSLRRLLVHFAHYSVASLLTTLAGLVSFPLLTRIFSVAEYGAMNLISATLGLAVAFGKVGVQHSVLRFHSEVVAGRQPFSERQFYSTIFVGMATTGFLATAVILIGTQIAPSSWFGEGPHLRTVFAIASLLVLVQVVESAAFNIARAEQLTSLVMKYQVAKKYFGLGMVLLAVFFVARNLTAFYSASVISDTLAILTLVFVLFRGKDRPHPVPRHFSPALYRHMLAYGIPMMIGYELSGNILAVGDRYVIEGMIGTGPLGLYSAAYNLCQYVQAVLIASVGSAIMPMYMQMWTQKGRDETAAFVSQSLRTYTFFAAPVIAGVAVVGPELLPSLASEKFASAGLILPWVIAGMVADGMGAMVGAGLFIERRTRTIMIIVSSCAALNLALNFLLIPRMGILGAAVATLVSYVASSAAMAYAGRQILPLVMPWATLARAALASLVMYGAVAFVLPGRRLITVGVRAVLGAIVYAVAIWLIDRDARAMVRRALARLRRS